MTPEHFFQKFAGTPLGDRLLAYSNEKPYNLTEIYEQMKRLSDRIRPLALEQGRLGRLAEDLFKAIESARDAVKGLE